jgi:hypothetical protein
MFVFLFQFDGKRLLDLMMFWRFVFSDTFEQFFLKKIEIIILSFKKLMLNSE